MEQRRDLMGFEWGVQESVQVTHDRDIVLSVPSTWSKNVLSLGLTGGDGSVAQESVRVTHNRDIVPSVPPTWVGFHHVATEVWIVEYDGAGVRPALNSAP
jgi:hypothetical protein